jgi:predicted DNA-binding transcriptional regulator AlpA
VARSSNALQVLPRSTEQQRVEPPADRGRLLTAAQVAAELFNDSVSTAWVRRNVPHKVVLGHSTVRWYAGDVKGWIDTLRAS